jgi:hypothetical protein
MGVDASGMPYLELHPELERFFMTGWHDDARGIFLTLGMETPTQQGGIGGLVHGFQTLPGMLSVIVAVVAGALGVLGALALGASQAAAVAIGVVAFLLTIGVLGFYGWRSINAFTKALTPQFRSPD